LLIDFFSPDDLSALAESLTQRQSSQENEEIIEGSTDDPIPPAAPEEPNDDELYSVTGFTV